MRRAVLPALLLSLFALHCASCVNQAVDAGQIAPGGASSAVMSTRKGGSVEGWVVTLTPTGLPKREVFQGEMPDPVSVDDVAHSVQLRWDSPSQLVIVVPRWVRGGTMSTAYIRRGGRTVR
jgi:hypothetical protein